MIKWSSVSPPGFVSALWCLAHCASHHTGQRCPHVYVCNGTPIKRLLLSDWISNCFNLGFIRMIFILILSSDNQEESPVFLWRICERDHGCMSTFQIAQSWLCNPTFSINLLLRIHVCIYHAFEAVSPRLPGAIGLPFTFSMFANDAFLLFFFLDLYDWDTKKVHLKKKIVEPHAEWRDCACAIQIGLDTSSMCLMLCIANNFFIFFNY